MAERSVRNSLRRRAEDVDYWRQRAGWFDDDETMAEYNDGVYDSYYKEGDGKNSGSGGSGNFSVMSSNSEHVKNGIKILSIVVSLVLIVIMYRVIARRMGDGKKEKKRSDSRSKSTRSRSRARSRSRSRKGGDYDLMDDKSDARSKRSSRSKSRSKSGRSRSRTRSRSKPHRETSKKPVLV